MKQCFNFLNKSTMFFDISILTEYTVTWSTTVAINLPNK